MPRFMSSLGKVVSIFGTSALAIAGGFGGYSYALAESRKGKDEDIVISSSGVDEKFLLRSQQLLQSRKTAENSDIHRHHIKKAIKESKSLIQRLMAERSIPGLVIGVSFKGHNIWVKGFGFSNLEQGSKCKADTVMRIASVSKPMTMIAVGKLIEEGKLDLDKSIYSYLKPEQFPRKKWQGKQVDITLRQLVSHLGGIRHYKKPDEPNLTELQSQEAYLASKMSFKDVFQSLDLFKNDDLVAEPGTKYSYTTHGFTLISAVIESVLPTGTTFPSYLVDKILRHDLGMESTFLDQNDPLIFDRAKNYVRTKTGVLQNAPYVNNSYKWAGGGLLSSVPDLLRFGRVMMYSYLGGHPRSGIKGYLKKETVEMMWTPVPLATPINPPKTWYFNYAMGWSVLRDFQEVCASCSAPPFSTIASHGGGAVGVSSALIIIPEHEMVVAVICNTSNTGIVFRELCCDVAEKFVSQLCPPKFP